MADLLQAARVRQSCSGTGANNVTLLAPVSSFQGFGDAFPVGSAVTYCLQDGDGVKWEVGRGTLISSSELSRDYVYSSSASSGYQHNLNPASRTKINLSSNSHQVFNTITPELFLFMDSDGQIADPTAFRATIFKATIAAMIAEALPATNETVICLGNASVSDGEGGMFRWDAADATAPDNIDTFRNANSSTGLHKRVRLDPVPELVYATTTALRAVDAAAKLKSGRRAIVLGRAAEGDRRPFHVQWDPASSATHDGAMVFRPSAGAASSGAGRWLRASNTPTQAFTSTDATPSIAGGDFFTTAGTTAITDFDDAYEGQVFTVERGASDIVITHNSSLIDLGGADLTLTAACSRAVFQHVGGVHKLISTPVQTGWTALLRAAVGTTLAVAHQMAKGFWGSLTIDTYANARLLTALSENVAYRLRGRAARNDGGQGDWYFDPTDTTTADNTGTVLVVADGGRLKRHIAGPNRARWFATPDGSTNHYSQLVALFALGGDLDLDGATYRTGGRLVMPAGTAAKWTVLDNGILKLHSTASGAGLGGLLQYQGYNELGLNLTLDGDQIGLTSDVIMGASNDTATGAVNAFRSRCRIVGFPFTGLALYSANYTLTHTNIDVSGTRVENVGWAGIYLEHVVRPILNNVSAVRTGYTPITTVLCTEIKSNGARASMKDAPWQTYLGMSPAGFGISTFGCTGSYTEFYVEDTEYDGVGLGEDGPDGFRDSGSMHFQGHVHLGGSGWVAVSNSTIDLLITEPKTTGLFLGRDFGGTIENISGRAVIQDVEPTFGAVNFAPPTEDAMTISTTNGSPTATVSVPGRVAIGQRIYSANVPSGTLITAVNGATITMSANATGTASGTAATMRGFVHFKNIDLEVVVDEATYAVAAFDGVLAGNVHGTYDQVQVSLIERDVTTPVIVYPTTTEPAGIVVANKTLGNTDSTLARERNSASAAVVAGSGSLTSANATVRYSDVVQRESKVHVEVNIPTNGTGAGAILVTLPFSVRQANFSGRENAVVGLGLRGSAIGTTLTIINDDGSYPGGDGRQLLLDGVCELN